MFLNETANKTNEKTNNMDVVLAQILLNQAEIIAKLNNGVEQMSLDNSSSQNNMYEIASRYHAEEGLYSDAEIGKFVEAGLLTAEEYAVITGNEYTTE